jgi:hypothetical protein
MKPYPTEPEPDERPSLVPPVRKPPSAVGTATLPPGGRPSSDYSRRPSLVARIGTGLVGSLFVAGGVGLCTLPGVGPILGAGAALTGLEMLTRSASGAGLWHRWRHQRQRARRRAAVMESRRRHQRGATSSSPDVRP